MHASVVCMYVHIYVWDPQRQNHIYFSTKNVTEILRKSDLFCRSVELSKEIAKSSAVLSKPQAGKGTKTKNAMK